MKSSSFFTGKICISCVCSFTATHDCCWFVCWAVEFEQIPLMSEPCSQWMSHISRLCLIGSLSETVGGKKKKIQETYRWVDRVWECVLVPSALAVKTQESRWHSSWAEETLNAVTPEHMYLQVFQRKRRRAPTPAEAPLIAMPGCQAGWCCPDAAPVVDELPCWRPSSPKAADRHWRTADTDTSESLPRRSSAGRHRRWGWRSRRL